MTTKESSVSDVAPAQLKMSYEEFLQWADEDIHAEWVDGEVIISMPPKNTHQTMLAFLHQLLSLFVQLFNLGKVGIAPFEVKLGAEGPSREPDIFFIAQENMHRLTEERVMGPPDLIVEIISPDSIYCDRQDKFREYCQAGVREYWIIDPRPGKQRADFYYLDPQGQYQLVATEDNERVESRVLPGFWLHPAWLWQAETLNAMLILFEKMANIPTEQVQQIQQMLRAGLTKAKE